MKRISFLLLTLLLIKSASPQVCHPQLFLATEDGQCDNNPYVLVFEDDFNGTTLDLSKWRIQPWGQGSLLGDLSQQYYSLDNVSVSSGFCSIIAKRDTVVRRAVNWLPDDAILADSLPNLRTYYFTSSNIWTNMKFLHGMYEIRCRIPSGKGFWPAYWAYGVDSTNSSEIDVFEFWDNNTSKPHMTVHHNGQMCESNFTGPDYSLDFHTYRVIWDNYKVEWYIDSVLKRRITKFNTLLGQTVECNEVQANHLYLLEKSFPTDSVNIITNLAIQTGTFAPDTTTPFPASFDIDYIRFYEQLPVTGITVLDSGQSTREHFKIKTYPNPNSGALSIEFGDNAYENFEFFLLDERGDMVYKSTAVKESSVLIDISRLSKGIYFLHVLDTKNNLDSVHKIIFN